MEGLRRRAVEGQRVESDGYRGQWAELKSYMYHCEKGEADRGRVNHATVEHTHRPRVHCFLPVI